MIKYKLKCKKCDVLFDSWFASSKEYEKLKKKNLLNCHICNSKEVEKTLMAPKLINSKENANNKLNTIKFNTIRKVIKDYRKFIKDNFKYVGENFVYEARSIHYDNKKKTKGIYGKASKKDIQELKNEGIETQEIPWVEDIEN